MQSPLPNTGMLTPLATRAMNSQSETPEYDCAAVRPCTATAAAPASSIRLASSGALSSFASQPARILTVTGIFTAFAIARTTLAACSGSRIRLQPALCFAIFGTGQPMLTSTMSAPMPSTICAAAAIFSGSPPKIWIETGRSSSVYSAYSSVRSIPRTSPSELTISVTTRPHPPSRLTRRRKAVSVIPAMGASANAGDRSMEPIFIWCQAVNRESRAGYGARDRGRQTLIHDRGLTPQ